MALKDIRVTFFYADEAIFDKVKQWRTRERIVKWANEFYKRYGFKIDEFPVPWNETVYKKNFSLAKTKGLQANYTEDVIQEEILQKILNQEIEVLLKESEELDKNPPADLVVHAAKSKDLLKRLHEFIEKREKINAISKSQRQFETLFRVAAQQKINELKTKNKKERLPVIFCESINLLELLKHNATIGETFGSQSPKPPHLIVWAAALIKGLDMYEGPFIIIDVNRITKQFDHVLAHEVVHAAGNTTLDNHGTPGNIMIYADSQGKAPNEVNLEPSDKAKMEAAFFVL